MFALDVASAVSVNDLDKFWLPEQTCSLRKAALVLAQAKDFPQNFAIRDTIFLAFFSVFPTSHKVCQMWLVSLNSSEVEQSGV